MYSLDDLIKHLKITHSIVVNQKQRKDLRNIGYYHGYKGYRFVRKATNVINFTNFDQVVSCSNLNVKINTSNLLGLPTNLDSDGALISHIIYALKDLRNSIAHNGIIFDTRFKTASINSRLVDLLTQETNILNIDFNYIDSYFVLIIYICRIMGQTRKECIGTIHEYNNRCEYLFKNIPQNIYFQILGSGHLSLISKLEEYVKNS